MEARFLPQFHLELLSHLVFYVSWALLVEDPQTELGWPGYCRNELREGEEARRRSRARLGQEAHLMPGKSTSDDAVPLAR